MTDKATRGGLALLGLVGLQIGVWAALAPRSFYDDFPGGGRTWVAADGPYNEHLVRDFGALNLTLTAVVAVALVTRASAAVRAAALGWLVYSLPHFVYHARHLEVYDTVDKILNLVVLGGAVLLSAAVLVAALGRRTSSSEIMDATGDLPHADRHLSE
jgi:hypothetical protein